MRFLYNVFIQFYGVIIWLLSIINKKAKNWIVGRKHWQINLKSNTTTDKKIVWIHCASLGEFEQGRTIIETIKKESKHVYVVLTFFSPSGYEVRKNYEFADYICYLPIDTFSNARTFIDILNPEIAIFVKYEFWYNYLLILKQRSIKTIFISAIFRQNQYFFKWYGSWFLKQLKSVNHFFVQDKFSAEILKTNHINNFTISGDTRFDRVYELSKSIIVDEIVASFTKNSTILIAGSTWHEDEQLLFDVLLSDKFQNLKIIIAPHTVDENNIEKLLQQWAKFHPKRYSKSTINNLHNSRLLIIDCVGKLMQLYKYGTFAYVGGGFGKGIHNILEPATFGLPIAFGPKYEKFNEAKELLNLKGAECVSTTEHLEKFLLKNLDKTILAQSSTICKSYVESKVGATSKVMNYIKPFL